MSRSPLTVVAVSSDALRPELLELLSVHDSSDAAIVVESIARAHARISQLQPALVVLLMEIDDGDACRLLSVLQNDRALCGVRVLLCPTEPGRAVACSMHDPDYGSDRFAAASC
jgi:hypothetical protein